MTTPEELVQAQVDAYNVRDLEAFLVVYAEQVAILNDGQETKLDKATLRVRYGKLFRENPGLRCEILKREVAGNIVIEGELIRRISFTRL